MPMPMEIEFVLPRFSLFAVLLQAHALHSHCRMRYRIMVVKH